jgi:hypothetical protein
MDWIVNGNAALANWVKRAMPEGDLRDLLTDGAIGASAPSSPSCRRS